MECDITAHNAKKIWHNELIRAIAHLALDLKMIEMVKKGLEFGQQVQLSSEVTFTPEIVATLFASEGRVRPFQQLFLE